MEIAAGEPLNVCQEEVVFQGHAIECRINAENPAFHFALLQEDPKLTASSRWDGTASRQCSLPGYTIPPYYDSMIAK